MSKVTYTLKKKRLSLLGHIIRTDDNDPIKQVTFANNDLEPRTAALRRVGRPRQKWIELTLKDAYDDVSDNEYTGTRSQNIKIRKRATDRKQPFD